MLPELIKQKKTHNVILKMKCITKQLLLKKITSPHLKDDDIVVAEGAELGAPFSIIPDDLVDEILEVQCQLLDTHALRHTQEFKHSPAGSHVYGLRLKSHIHSPDR